MFISIWTKDRLTGLFGPDFENILTKPPGREQLDAPAKKLLLERFASGIRSNKLRITDVLTPNYLDAAIRMILSKEKLDQYIRTGKEPAELGQDMENGLRGSINDPETLDLIAQMVEETIRRL